jgi:hypothetical protein
MPEFSFRKTRCGACVLWAASQSICSQARAQLQVARIEAAFQQQDRSAPAQCADPLGLQQVQQRETVGTAQRVVHPLDPVAVGVGLDHRPDLRVRRRLLDAPQVVAQGVGMDGGKNGTRHERQLTAAILSLPAVL